MEAYAGLSVLQAPLFRSSQNYHPSDRSRSWLLGLSLRETLTHYLEPMITNINRVQNSGTVHIGLGEMAGESVTDSIFWTCPEEQREELERWRRKTRFISKAARVQLQQFMTLRETLPYPNGLYTIMATVHSSSLHMFPSRPHPYQKESQANTLKVCIYKLWIKYAYYKYIFFLQIMYKIQI